MSTAALVSHTTSQQHGSKPLEIIPNCFIDGLEALDMSHMTADMAQVYRWDFNVFEFAQTAGGRPLYNVTMALMEDQGLLDGWLLERQTVERYLTHVESMYKPNPYHNNTHAADVTQTAGVIMCSLDQHLSGGSSSSCCKKRSGGTSCNSSAAVGSAFPSSKPVMVAPPSAAAGNPQQQPQGPSNGLLRAGGLSKYERFAIILASAVHDLGHPGVNNLFLQRTRDPQALIYNDRHVNENMHCSLAFRLAADNPALNVFERFSTAEYDHVRKLVVDMVLQTDMEVHFDLLKKFETALAASPDVRTWATQEQRSLLFQMLVHLADLANPSRPWHLALKWAEGVVTEFLQQGKREVKVGLDVSDMCNIDKVCMPAAQLFFIERFMQPTLEAFSSAAPSFYRMALPWLADTKAKWTCFREAGVKLPYQEYPVLPPSEGQLCAVLGGNPGCCCHAHGKQQEQ